MEGAVLRIIWSLPRAIKFMFFSFMTKPIAPNYHLPILQAIMPESDFLDETIRVWQPYSAEHLTRENAREIACNVLRFMKLLKQWADEDRQDADRARNCFQHLIFRRAHIGSIYTW